MVGRLSIELDIVYDSLVVSNPVRGLTSLYMLCHGIRFSYHGFRFSYEDFVLGFSGYDLILGIYFMSKLDFLLDYDERLVRMRYSGGHRLDVLRFRECFYDQLHVFA